MISISNKLVKVQIDLRAPITHRPNLEAHMRQYLYASIYVKTRTSTCKKKTIL